MSWRIFFNLQSISGKENWCTTSNHQTSVTSSNCSNNKLCSALECPLETLVFFWIRNQFVYLVVYCLFAACVCSAFVYSVVMCVFAAHMLSNRWRLVYLHVRSQVAVQLQHCNLCKHMQFWQNTSQIRNYLHQFDNTSADNTQNTTI